MNHIISHYCLYVGECVTHCTGIVKIKEVTWSWMHLTVVVLSILNTWSMHDKEVIDLLSVISKCCAVVSQWLKYLQTHVRNQICLHLSLVSARYASQYTSILPVLQGHSCSSLLHHQLESIVVHPLSCCRCSEKQQWLWGFFSVLYPFWSLTLLLNKRPWPFLSPLLIYFLIISPFLLLFHFSLIHFFSWQGGFIELQLDFFHTQIIPPQSEPCPSSPPSWQNQPVRAHH